MRLTSIEIENFCRHRQMRVTFCPHINVLAAPNDFGKSTLVEAIRAALLLPSTSKEGQTFVPWGTDATPKVILCFSLNGIDWRVSKSFGSTRGQAILEKCNNGQWSEEAKGRDVDGSLRKLLQWGVPEPGGKDAPKGWPKSYLVNALLGRQDDVAGLLELDLANDKLDSGRQLISKVLDSFSQDPLVTKLLKGLEDEIYGEFTSTGQLSRGANTKLSPLTREISKLEKEIDEQQIKVSQSEGVEARIPILTDELTKLAKKVAREKHWVEALSSVRNAETILTTEEAYEQKYAEINNQLENAEYLFSIAKLNLDEDEAAWQLHLNNIQNAKDRLNLADSNLVRETEVGRLEREHRRDFLKTVIDRADQNTRIASEAIYARIQADEAILAYSEQVARCEAAGVAVARNRKLAVLVNILDERERARELIIKSNNLEADADSFNLKLGQAEKDATNAFTETQLALSRLNEVRANLTEITHRSKELNRDIDTTKNVIEQWKERVRILTQHEAHILEANDCSDRIDVEKLAITKIRQQVADGERQMLESNQTRSKIMAQSQTQLSWIQSARLMTIVWVLANIASALPALLFGASTIVLVCITLVASLTITGIVGCLHRLYLKRLHLRECDRQLAELVQSVDQINLAQQQNVGRLGMVELRLENNLSEFRRLSAGLGPLQEAYDECQSNLIDAKNTLQGHQKALNAMIDESRRAPTITEKHVIDAVQFHEKHIRLEADRGKTVGFCRTAAANAKAAADVARIAAAGINMAAIDARVAVKQADWGVIDGLPKITPEEAQELVAESERFLRMTETDLKLAEQRRNQAEKTAQAAESNLDNTAEHVLDEAEITRNQAQHEMTELSPRISPIVASADLECQIAREGLEALESLTLAIKSARDTAVSNYNEAARKRNTCQINLQANRQSSLAIGTNAARAVLNEAFAALPNDTPKSTKELPSLQNRLDDSKSQLKQLSESLERLRGQLALVGGNIARDRLAELRARLARQQRIADDRELDLNAHYMAFKQLQAAEAEYAAHLGRFLAEPVSKAFSELTNQRYGELTLDPGLAISNVTADDAPRACSLLSVGTRDQLATLIRVAVARAIGSALILDDHLTHSDEAKLAWFCTHLRRCATNNGPQIIVFTCRPKDYQSLLSDLSVESENHFAGHCRFTNLLTAAAK